MPFSKHYVVPEHMDAVRSAYYKVCDALLLNHDVNDPLTEVIVNELVALTKAGEHDPDRLAELVLNELADDCPTPPRGQPRRDPSPQV